MGFPGGSDGKESACIAGDLSSIPGQEDLLEKGMATHSCILHFLCDSAGKESTCNAGDLVQSLGWDEPLEMGKATHSRVLAWRIP